MKTINRRYYRSSSFKMAAFFALLLGLSAMLLGYFLYDFSKQNFARETEAVIDSEMAHILSSLEHKNAAYIESYINNITAKNTQTLYLYTSAHSEPLAGNLTAIPNDIKRIKEGIISFEATINNQNHTLAAKIHTFGDGSRLLIARDIGAIMQNYQTLKWLSILIMAFMLIVVLVSFFISIFVVSRINLIARTAQHIMETGDLSKRISIEGSWDDLSHLAQILNTMFARIEELVESIKDVSDSIAHDLRTPLTRLRQHLEESLKKKLSQQQKESLIQEADNLLETFNSLLRISNIEKGNRHQAFETLNAANLIQDVVELYEPILEEKHITLTLSPCEQGNIKGDKHLLFQLFANLLDNAIKFSPEKSHIRVNVRHSNDCTIASIADQGVGLKDHEKEKVFTRFYRADKSRHTTGNGLGLSLVKAIAELHKATITLEDNNPGCRISIHFPGI